MSEHPGAGGAPVDLRQAAAFVAARYGAAAAATLAPAGAGEWSRAFSLTHHGRDLVIRFGRHRTDFVKDARMGELAAGTALPVPRVREIGDTPWGSFVTADRCAGTYLDDLDGPGMRAALPDLLVTLDRIADLAPPGAGFGIWGADAAAPHRSWRDALLAVAVEQPRTAGWRERLATRKGPAAVFERGLAALDERLRDLAHRRVGAVRRIVHGDLLNRNVLVAGVAVTAVLDWGNALYGDPAYDAAWLMFWWPWYPAWRAIDIGDEIRAHVAARRGGGPADPGAGLDARLAAYQLHIGLDALTYQAFTGRWDVMDRVADQVAGLLSGGPR